MWRIGQARPTTWAPPKQRSGGPREPGLDHGRARSSDGTAFDRPLRLPYPATMREVRSSELQSQLVDLLDDVEAGETIVITRDGRPVARLVPEASAWSVSSSPSDSPSASESDTKPRSTETIERLRKLRESLPKAGISIDEAIAMRHEGHRY
ncbi:type II toxin-antitoxin system prevent-host-death family antitoxin [Aquibium carbonis]|uniref:Antitoxin n=1 Tax=Aquibium carbonis TaxID=2495581 RepID=A0A3S0A3P1_9HYPH|nr:type II toxin-antitoxin system prevent-host-death family antitoxin [Aquibium carbonis]RST88175.1 type II toxin-antitoxin system prevent-host-death family antitoxin [Aquibium carbonis]